MGNRIERDPLSSTFFLLDDRTLGHDDLLQVLAPETADGSTDEVVCADRRLADLHHDLDELTRLLTDADRAAA